MSFTKTDKQKEAIKTLSEHDYTALYGGSRSGKTFILLYAIIVRAAMCKSRHAVVRQQFASIKRSIWLDTLPKVKSICFPNLAIVANNTDYFITLPNGSQIWFAGMDNARIEKILGTEYSTIYFNEASEMEYESVQLVISRLAEKNSLRKRVWFDFNPPTKSHWSYWMFLNKIDPIDEVPFSEPDMYGHLLMNPKDNLANIDKEYLKLLGRMPEKQRERFLEGLFTDIDDGRAYYAFDREKHVSEIKKNSESGIGKGTIIVGMDFNVDPMTAVVCSFIDGIVYVFDEVYLNNSDTYKMCSELRKRGYVGQVIPDSTGRNRRTSGKSDFKILEDHGHYIVSTRNPFISDRVNNVNRLLTDDRIVIDRKCRKLINDLERVSWKDNVLDQKGTNKHLTHISDALGYVCCNLLPLVKIRKSKQEII